MKPPVCDFGWKAPDFQLPGIDGDDHSLDTIKGERATLVMFICNHCPYVVAIAPALAEDCRVLQAAGVGIAAINANDTDAYPADSFENMGPFADRNGFMFPYLYDASQSVARAYDAICTPDFFGFNGAMELQYRGRFDSRGMNANAQTSRHELLDAMLQIAKTGVGPQDQTASIGCSIKWRSGAA